jgi:hypothetical protein
MKIVEKWSQPWRLNPAFSSGAGNLQGYIEPNMSNFPILKTPRRLRVWDNTETIESNKDLSQPTEWNPGGRQRKMTTNNSRTLISEPSPNNVEKRNSSKEQTVLEKFLDELESIQTEDEVKNVLVTIMNLVINSGDIKGMVRYLWKAVKLREQLYNKIQWESTN